MTIAPDGRFEMLEPFIDITAYRDISRRSSSRRIVTVAMMRPGDKLESYRLLARALERIAHLPWTISIAGDGPCRPGGHGAICAAGSCPPGMAGRTASRRDAVDLWQWCDLRLAGLRRSLWPRLPRGAGGGIAGRRAGHRRRARRRPQRRDRYADAGWRYRPPSPTPSRRCSATRRCGGRCRRQRGVSCSRSDPSTWRRPGWRRYSESIGEGPNG